MSPNEKVSRAISRLPDPLRTRARGWFRRAIRAARYGSPSWNSHRHANPVTGAQRELMRQVHKAGMSFRVIEKVFHLKDNSGNNAQRCVREATRQKHRQAALSRA